MMMPANFSAVAENELTYVVGGFDLAAYLAPEMTAKNWANVNTNLINIVGNAYLNKYLGGALKNVFGGSYIPGTTVGNVWNGLSGIWNNNIEAGKTEGWGLAKALVNTGLQVVGGLSAIYTLGSGSIGLKLNDSLAKGSEVK